MTRTLQVAARAYDEILRHARDAAPEECCGLLLGHPWQVVEAVRARNAAGEPRRRFLVNPADHFRALRRARGAGVEIIGAYHSHPAGTAYPSETDRADAIEDETFVHAIVAVRTGEIAAYALVAGRFVSVPLVRMI